MSGEMRDMVRYWELRRIPYNLALIALALSWIVATWPHFQPAMTLWNLLKVFILAALANLCYCAAYLVDVSLQASHFRPRWVRWRWVLWVVGTFFALMITCYWIADEVYPYV